MEEQEAVVNQQLSRGGWREITFGSKVLDTALAVGVSDSIYLKFPNITSRDSNLRVLVLKSSFLCDTEI